MRVSTITATFSLLSTFAHAKFNPSPEPGYSGSQLSSDHTNTVGLLELKPAAMSCHLTKTDIMHFEFKISGKNLGIQKWEEHHGRMQVNGLYDLRLRKSVAQSKLKSLLESCQITSLSFDDMDKSEFTATGKIFTTLGIPCIETALGKLLETRGKKVKQLPDSATRCCSGDNNDDCPSHKPVMNFNTTGTTQARVRPWEVRYGYQPSPKGVPQKGPKIPLNTRQAHPNDKDKPFLKCQLANAVITFGSQQSKPPSNKSQGFQISGKNVGRPAWSFKGHRRQQMNGLNDERGKHDKTAETLQKNLQNCTLGEVTHRDEGDTFTLAGNYTEDKIPCMEDALAKLLKQRGKKVKPEIPNTQCCNGPLFLDCPLHRLWNGTTIKLNATALNGLKIPFGGPGPVVHDSNWFKNFFHPTEEQKKAAEQVAQALKNSTAKGLQPEGAIKGMGADDVNREKLREAAAKEEAEKAKAHMLAKNSTDVANIKNVTTVGKNKGAVPFALNTTYGG